VVRDGRLESRPNLQTRMSALLVAQAFQPAAEFGHSGVPIPVDLPEGETRIARQFTAGDELELIESRRDG